MTCDPNTKPNQTYGDSKSRTLFCDMGGSGRSVFMAGNGAVLARCAGHNGGFIFFKQFPPMTPFLGSECRRF